ncbi:hypothetical protein F2P79_005762 [Pimephales promelas]|nr:hypothetical protein F2P79_005762 [Pimephales promelas]
MKAASSLSDNLMEPKQRQVTVWLTKSKLQDFSGPMNNRWTINLGLRSQTSSETPSKRIGPADCVVK